MKLHRFLTYRFSNTLFHAYGASDYLYFAHFWNDFLYKSPLRLAHASGASDYLYGLYKQLFAQHDLYGLRARMNCSHNIGPKGYPSLILQLVANLLKFAIWLITLLRKLLDIECPPSDVRTQPPRNFQSDTMDQALLTDRCVGNLFSSVRPLNRKIKL